MLMAVFFSTAIMVGCGKPADGPAEEPDPQTIDLVDLNLSVPVPSNWPNLYTAFFKERMK